MSDLTYKDVVGLFESGSIDYQQLMAAVTKLPPPAPPEEPASIEEFYHKGESDPGPNDAKFWLASLYIEDLISIEQLAELQHASVASPTTR